MPIHGKTIEIPRLSYDILAKGHLMENLKAPFEMGIVEKLLSATRVGANGKWFSVYLVKTC